MARHGRVDSVRVIGLPVAFGRMYAHVDADDRSSTLR